MTHLLLDSKHIAPKLKVAYTKDFWGLFKFLTLIGDYNSLVVLHMKSSTTKTPRMNENSVALYMPYKTGAVGALLTYIGSEDPVLDVNGDAIRSCAEWDNIGNVTQFLSAILTVHRAISQRSIYRDACDA
jgi:hypothetical protein